MYSRCAAVGLSLIGLLSLTPGQASCSTLDARPLELGFASSFSPPARADRADRQPELRPGASRQSLAAGRRAAGLTEAEKSLRQRALQSVLNAPDLTPDESSAGPEKSMDQFRFERQGSALRNFSRGYKDVCAKVSGKIWDDPNGRRIKFDIAGKPGVAIEIPLR